MSEKRRGLGRGLGALIPTGWTASAHGRRAPVDVFFPDPKREAPAPRRRAAAGRPPQPEATPET